MTTTGYNGRTPVSDKQGDKHRDREREKRDTDGQGPINPDTVREPKPGKRGK